MKSNKLLLLEQGVIMKKLSAVVTSTGIATAVGLSEEESRQAIINGKSGIKLLEGYEYRGAGLPVGCCDIERVKDYLTDQGIAIAANEQRNVLLALYVVHQALQKAPALRAGEKRGLYVGSSLTSHDSVAHSYELIFSGKRNTASAIVECANYYLTARLSRQFDLREMCATITSSCASGLQCISFAMRDLALDLIEEAVVVGVDSALAKGLIDTWMSARILSRIEPIETAARPFCNTRRGFVYAEGAACVILRKAAEHGLLEILGVNANCGADNLFAVSEKDMVRCMQGTLESAGMTPEGVDFIHANANGSRQGDLEEAKALNAVFGRTTPVYSAKALCGNTHGAQGINNLIHALLILENGSLPVNPHLYEKDPEVDGLINCGYEKGAHSGLKTGMLNTFGFAGMNASLIFRKV
jgi:3-oxoacyl-(acyl-carrier-protein) synthase